MDNLQRATIATMVVVTLAVGTVVMVATLEEEATVETAAAVVVMEVAVEDVESRREGVGSH